mmetsp:Transcript_36148/g.81240  ORF Transcript_36148/g.81240 Transcript_36148/m.81240 type:complete len:88 (-) Transcript_36148:208-471(-)
MKRCGGRVLVPEGAGNRDIADQICEKESWIGIETLESTKQGQDIDQCVSDRVQIRGVCKMLCVVTGESSPDEPAQDVESGKRHTGAR